MASASPPSRIRELLAQASRAIDAGAYPQAEAACREVLNLDPKHPDAWYLLAGIALTIPKYPQAEELARKATALNPLHPGAWHSLGMALKGQGRLEEAVTCFRRSAQFAPKVSAGWNSLGATLNDLGRKDEAVEALRKAIGIDPRNAAAHHNLAVSLAERGDLAGAIRHYEQATAINPRLAKSHSNLGSLYVQVGRREDAEARFRAALAIDPKLPEANNNLGILLQEQARIPEAFACFEAAIAARPGFAPPHNNAALAAKQVGDIARARAGFTRAIELDPAFQDPWWNLANLERDEGNYAAARERIEEAVRRFPATPMASHSLGVLDLLEGRLAEGWRGLTWREVLTKYEMHHPPRPPVGFCPPRPDAPVEVVDLVAEQGLGDVVFYSRWAPRLREIARRVVFHTEPRLKAILGRTGAFDELAGKDAWQHREGAFEVRVADLPWITGPEREPPPPQALTALPERVEALRARLAEAGPPPYVGLTWRAGIKTLRGYDKLFKEVPLEALFRAAGGRKATFVSLQREPAAGDLALARERLGVADFGWINDDLEDALALLALLEEYIGVSNTNMHLRAGLGLPTRVLVPCPPEWRYGKAGERSVFFPQATLYRQDFAAGWLPALERLAYDLNPRP